MYNYKYNGKELQETGMYDYGARMYMPDLGRWGVIDPRSQYTHETYSYVWNNPISFNDPTGMEGEAFSDWIHNPTNGRYKWDPNVTGPGNTPEGWNYVGPTGSYRIDGATVQLLEGGKTMTSIDEVFTRGKSGVNAAAITIGVGSSESGVGLFILLAVFSKLIIDDIFNTPLPVKQGIRIDPNMYRHTDNAESEADDTDVNGVKVPQEAKPDARTEPKDLQEQLALEEAKSGEGSNYKGKLNDPKYHPETGTHDKKAHNMSMETERQLKCIMM